MAAVTERIILTTGVLIVPLRPRRCWPRRWPPSTTSRAADSSSAWAPSWQPEEFTAQNLDPDQRGQLLTDHIAACARCGPARRPPSSRSTSRSRTSGPSPDRRDPADHPCCSRARSRPATCGASSSWATAGSIMGATHDDVVAGVGRLRTAAGGGRPRPTSLMVRASAHQRDGRRPDLVASLGHMGASRRRGSPRCRCRPRWRRTSRGCRRRWPSWPDAGRSAEGQLASAVDSCEPCASSSRLRVIQPRTIVANDAGL